MNSLTRKGQWIVVVHTKRLGGVSVLNTQSDGGGRQLR